MNEREFTTWLEGFTDGLAADCPTPTQWAMIRVRLSRALGRQQPVQVSGPSKIEIAIQRPDPFKSNEKPYGVPTGVVPR